MTETSHDCYREPKPLHLPYNQMSQVWTLHSHRIPDLCWPSPLTEQQQPFLHCVPVAVSAWPAAAAPARARWRSPAPLAPDASGRPHLGCCAPPGDTSCPCAGPRGACRPLFPASQIPPWRWRGGWPGWAWWGPCCQSHCGPQSSVPPAWRTGKGGGII